MVVEKTAPKKRWAPVKPGDLVKTLNAAFVPLHRAETIREEIARAMPNEVGLVVAKTFPRNVNDFANVLLVVFNGKLGWCWEGHLREAIQRDRTR